MLSFFAVALSVTAVTVAAANARYDASRIVQKRIPDAALTPIQQWEHIAKHAKFSSTQVTLEAAADDTVDGIGWGAYSQALSGSCSGGGTTLKYFVQYGTCLSGTTTLDASASQFITYDGYSGGVYTFSTVTYGTSDCSGSTVSSSTMNLPDSCSGGFTFTGVSDSFEPKSGFNIIFYNTESGCNTGVSTESYSNVESAVVVSSGTCVDGAKYSCSDIQLYDNADCSGTAVQTYDLDAIGSSCFGEDDDGDDDDDDDDDGDDDFEATEYTQFLCNAASSLTSSGVLASVAMAALAVVM